MATAEELRRLREEQSIFSALYDMARQQQSELAAEGRRPVLGGLLSKEPVYGTDTLRYEGIGDMLVGLLSPAAKAVDAPISAYRGTIPQEDMISEALGVGGLAMAGGGAVAKPKGSLGAFFAREDGTLEDALKLAKSGRGIFHSSQADQFDEINKYGVEPQYGPWTREIAEGATEDPRFLDEMPMAAWWSEQPDWVKMKTARAAGKNVNDVTVDDIRKYGHLSIADADEYADTVYRIPEEGIDYEGSQVSDLTGEKMPLYATDLYEFGDDNVGRYPFGIERNELVTRETIDPKYSLTGQDLIDFLRDYDTTAANASKSAGLLTTAASEAQDMAKRILELRAEGRASEVTDEMMAQADPQYMFANTPLPMDEASRMARAEAAGFGGDGLHGTHLGSFREMFDAFDKEKGLSSETYIAPNTQEGVELISQFNSADTGASMPVMHRENLLDTSGMSGAAIPREKKQAWNILGKTGDYSGLPHWSNFKAISSARDAGYDGIKLEERDWVNSTAIFEPRNIRSRFARFDPEFAHLSNLSAANVSPLGGLLAQSGVSDKQAERIEEYLRRRGLLD